MVAHATSLTVPYDGDMTKSPRATPVAPEVHDLDAWRAFLQAHALLSRRLDDELRAEQSMSLAEYDALIQLAVAPERRLRMNQLADRVLLSRSGVTRLVDRLVADGLVERSACTTDARGAEAVLTRAGVARLRAASTTHLRGVERYFIEPLSEAERGALGRSLGSVIDNLRAGADLDACAPSVAEPAGVGEPATSETRPARA